MEYETLATVFGTIFAVTFLLQAVAWLRVARLYGGSRMAAFRLMLATTWVSQSRWILIVAPMSILGTVHLTSDPTFLRIMPIGIILGLVATPLVAMMVRLRPPAVLFLGSSVFSQQLYQSLRLRTNRYRVIAFLVLPPDFVGAQALLMDGFRTRSIDWESVVRRVVDSVPLVVIDTRRATPQLVEESRWLIASPKRKQVIFVSTDSGALPALAQLNVDTATAAGLNVVRENQCVDAVRYLLKCISVRTVDR